VLDVLHYGIKAWTLKGVDMKRLEAFEIWIYRKILGISWVERVTNVEVILSIRREK